MNLLKTEIAFPPELMDTVFMRLGFIILPGVLLTLSACGRGGATLETDNVQAEWFPKGSRTAIILENETEPGTDKAARNAPAALTLLYTSHGDGQGVLSVNGNSPETATVRRQEANVSATFHFKTPSMKSASHPRMETRHGCPAGLIRNSPVRDTAPERPAPLPSRTTHPGSQTCP